MKKLHYDFGVQLLYTPNLTNEKIIQLVKEHSIVVLDNISFNSKQDFQNYTSSFGTLMPALHTLKSKDPWRFVQYLDSQGLTEVTDFAKEISPGSNGSQMLHQDGSNYYPSVGIIGFATVKTYNLPDGDKTSDTNFVSSKLMYDNFSPEFKKFLRTLNIEQTPKWVQEYSIWVDEIIKIHSGDNDSISNNIIRLRQSMGDAKIRKLVDTSDWGFEYLNLSLPMYNNLLNVSPAENYGILHLLETEIQKPQYSYSHRWEENQLVIYDNRRLLHQFLDNSTTKHSRQYWRTQIDVNHLKHSY